jgi:transposase
MGISMIGLDLAKNVFQLHCVDGAGCLVERKRLRRGQVAGFFAGLPPVVVGMEACSGSHFWARLLQGFGHEVRMMPPAYVKPFVRRNKTDSRDAQAICEAMQRPDMRFVPVKSAAQQAVLALHRTRELLVRQRTQCGNALRGMLAEFGIVAPQGRQGLKQLMNDTSVAALPGHVGTVVSVLAANWARLDGQIADLETCIVQAVRKEETARRLLAVPGIGPIAASAVLAYLPDPHVFRSGRGFAAWVGLTPRQSNSADKRRSGGISKQGQRSLRTLLILGASAHLRQVPRQPEKDPWVRGLLARRPVKVAAVARAAKNARIIWAMLARDEAYRPSVASAA